VFETWELILTIACSGAIGGVVECARSGESYELKLPFIGSVELGFLGHAFAGGVVSCVAMALVPQFTNLDFALLLQGAPDAPINIQELAKLASGLDPAQAQVLLSIAIEHNATMVVDSEGNASTTKTLLGTLGTSLFSGFLGVRLLDSIAASADFDKLKRDTDVLKQETSEFMNETVQFRRRTEQDMEAIDGVSAAGDSDFMTAKAKLTSALASEQTAVKRPRVLAFLAYTQKNGFDNYREARRLISEAIDLEPQSLLYYNRACYTALESGDTDIASILSDLAEAVRLRPKLITGKQLISEEDLESVRSDPKFIAFVESLSKE